MKIAIIGSKGVPAKYGGIQNVVENLAENLSNRNHKIDVYARYYYSKKKDYKYKYKNFNVINIKGIKTKRLDAVSHTLLSLLKASIKDYDLITIHSLAGAFLAFIPKICGKKVIFHSHGLEFLGLKWGRLDQLLFKILSRITAFFWDGVSIVSYSQREIAEKVFHKKVILIPNGFEPQKIKNTNISTSEKYILFVGRIVPEKGIEYLIEAFNQIDTHKNVKLKIVGQAVNSSDYYIKLKKMLINDRIEFTGVKTGSELIQLYENAQIVVIPSVIESFGLVLLESIYYNGVVIASDISEFKFLAKEYIEFFESKNADELFLKMNFLLDSTKERDLAHKKSIKFPFENYSWDKITTQYEFFYNSVV